MRYLKTYLILSLLFIVACGAETGQVLVDTDADAETAQISEVNTDESDAIESAPAIVTESETSTEVDVEQESQVETDSDVASTSAAVTSSNQQTVPAIQAISDCPTDAFIDVTTYVQNQAYPAPELSVTCTAESIVINSNGIPNFEFVQLTPGDLAAQDYSWTIPLNPTLADSPTDIPLLGTVAIAVNGLPIYGPNEGGNLGFGDPYLDQILDFCNGHTGPGGTYHFHAPPDCLFEEYEGSIGLVIGYALDGYPILAPFVCGDADCSFVEELQSSWQKTSDVTAAWDAHEYVEGSGDLDQCNGRETDTGYAYFATATFPYFLGCYSGEVDIDTNNGDRGEPQGGGQGGGPPEGAPPRGDGNRPPRDDG